MTNICKICGANSDVVEFYNGNKSRCKDCHKAKVRENRAVKSDYYKQYDAQRFQNDPRVKDRHKRYKATEEGKASIARSRHKWMAANPDKRAAHVLLGNAVRDGRVVKPKDCQRCGCTPSRIEGHHGDYTKPLDVLWVCRKCHIDIHREEENKSNDT